VTLVNIIRGLNASGVEYVVIGGVAAGALGSGRITNDTDICYRASDENRARLARQLADWHAYLRAVEQGLPFIMDARTLRDVPVLTLITDEGDLDVMDRVEGVGAFDAVLAASQPATIEGAPTRVLSIDALIASKRATRRRKDEGILIELEALREERRKRGLP